MTAAAQKIAAKETTIRISEIFGPTIQGEGLLIGLPHRFRAHRWLRLPLFLVRYAACGRQRLSRHMETAVGRSDLAGGTAAFRRRAADGVTVRR